MLNNPGDKKTDSPPNTIFIRSGSPVRVTISPQTRSRVGHLTPPVLHLSTPPQSPGLGPSGFKLTFTPPLGPRESPPRVLCHSRESENLPSVKFADSHFRGNDRECESPQTPPSLSLSPPALTPPGSRPSSASSSRRTSISSDFKLGTLEVIYPEQVDPNAEWAIDFDPLILPPPALSTDPVPAPPPAVPPPAEEKEQVSVKRYRMIFANIAYHLLLMALVAPNAMNAFCEPSGVKPADINGEWWDKLSDEIKIKSFRNAILAMWVNVYVQRDFIPQALKELIDSSRKCCKNPQEFFLNTVILVASFSAALSFAAMSADAFKWAGPWASAGSGLASLATSFTTRYPSVKKAHHKIKSYANKNRRLQKQIADRLRHLKGSGLEEFNRLLAFHHFKLNGKDIANLMLKLGEHLQGLPQNEILCDKTRQERIKDITLLVLEIIYPALISSTAFQLFTQKGFDGINTIAHLLHDSLDHFTRWEQFGVGITGGLVSTILYILASLSFLVTLIFIVPELAKNIFSAGKGLLFNLRETLRETYQHPQQFFRFLQLVAGLIAVWYTSSNMVTVGNVMVANLHGIFQTSTLALAFYRDIFPALNGLGGITLNTTSVVNQMLKKEREETKKHPQLDDVAAFLEENLLPATLEIKNPESKENDTVATMTYLTSFSIFKIKSNTEPALELHELNPKRPLLEAPQNLARPAAPPRPRPSAWASLTSSCTIM